MCNVTRRQTYAHADKCTAYVHIDACLAFWAGDMNGYLEKEFMLGSISFDWNGLGQMRKNFILIPSHISFLRITIPNIVRATYLLFLAHRTEFDLVLTHQTGFDLA
ncbi:unnamed protein product [Onchocerca flexuosa]|uniref:Uncharacterized protein n=1 Tax=Onchocerca flexuosa TaxID=387005 RepID=A0A183HGX4_9BILA|nr:unnamed protein product [Onchocerca flexuosa]